MVRVLQCPREATKLTQSGSDRKKDTYSDQEMACIRITEDKNKLEKLMDGVLPKPIEVSTVKCWDYWDMMNLCVCWKLRAAARGVSNLHSFLELILEGSNNRLSAYFHRIARERRKAWFLHYWGSVRTISYNLFSKSRRDNPHSLTSISFKRRVSSFREVGLPISPSENSR